MDKEIEKGLKRLERQGHRISISKHVELVGSALWKQKRIIVVTDLSFLLYKKGSSSPSDEEVWQDLKGISIKDDTIHFKFLKSVYTIKSPEFASIIGSVAHIIQGVLNPTELENCGIYQYPIFKSKPNPCSMYSRYSNLKFRKGAKLHKDDDDLIRDIIKFRRQIVYLKDFVNVESIFPFFLDYLTITRYVNTVVIHGLPNKDHFKYAASILGVKTNISNIVFKKAEIVNYQMFIDALRVTSTNIVGVYFIDCLLTEKELEPLISVYTSKRVRTIAFNSSIDGGALDYFYTTFLRSSVTDSLQVLNLDGTKNLNISTLLLYIPNVLVLSIADCDIDVSTIFKSILDAPLVQLHTVNMSGNTSLSPIDELYTMPASIASIVANNIAWTESTLIPFFKVVLKSAQSGLKLSLAYAECSTDEWVRIFNFLSRTDYHPLVSLVWDGSPVSEDLFKFLAKNKYLEFLSFNGCFTPKYAESVNLLTHYLSKGPGIKYFSCRSTQDKVLGSALIKIAAALKNCDHLKYIDVSGNGAGDEGITAISQHLLESRKTRVLLVDGTRPDNIDVYTTFLNLAAIQQNIMISFPSDDIVHIKEMSHAPNSQINALIQEFYIKKKEREYVHTTFALPPVDVFDDKFTLYQEERQAEFPMYFTHDDLNELTNTCKARIDAIDYERFPFADKKLGERMNVARKLIYGEKVEPYQITDQSTISTVTPDRTFDENTTDNKLIVNNNNNIGLNNSESSAISKKKKEKYGKNELGELELPKQSETRTSSSQNSQSKFGDQSTVRSRRGPPSRKSEKTIVPDWSVIQVRLIVDVDKFWNEMEDAYSIQNLFGEIRDEKQH